MPKIAPVDYKSTIVNASDGLPWPRWQEMASVIGGTTYTIDLTPPATAHKPDQRPTMVMIQYSTRPPATQGILYFTMDGTAPTPAGPGMTLSIGPGADQIVMDKNTVIRSLDKAVEIQVRADTSGVACISFW